MLINEKFTKLRTLLDHLRNKMDAIYRQKQFHSQLSTMQISLTGTKQQERKTTPQTPENTSAQHLTTSDTNFIHYYDNLSSKITS